jgi:hypothetical protein
MHVSYILHTHMPKAVLYNILINFVHETKKFHVMEIFTCSIIMSALKKSDFGFFF